MVVQEDLLLKKVTALSAILIMLVSLVSISSMGSQAANGQTNMSTCEKVPVRQVGANGERGTATAALAVDNDPATRWAMGWCTYNPPIAHRGRHRGSMVSAA